MKRTIILLVLALPFAAILLAGCGDEPAPIPTPIPANPAEIAMTMMAQKVDAEATQMAVNVQFTATAQVIWVTQNVQNTQAALGVTEQARKDAQATDARNRQDAAATEQQKRDDAAATEQRKRDEAATEQARRDLEATAEQGRQNVIGTATAQMVATWNAATLQVLPIHDQWTQQAVAVEQALATNEVELSNLEVKQQSDKNTLEWLIPFLISLAMTALVSMYVIRRSRVREIKNDETGETDAVIMDNKKAFKPQLMARPLMLLEVGAEHVDPKEQSEVTRRAQGVQALKALPANVPPQMSTSLYNNVFGNVQQDKPRIEIVDAEVVKEWVEDVTRQADDKEAR
ncbi:MAG: hypothetical protein C4583_04210 [Anaerolineaceae bacterium]|nr:MAG: hypothetical protein C4583_04210 [Anaerolineaceae bacterium]